MEEGGEVASRMTAVIGILGLGGAAMVVAATGTGTVIGDLVGGPKVALVASKLRTAVAVEGMVDSPVASMEATVMAAVMDRDILELQQIRWVSLVTRASRAPRSLGACRGLLRMG